jgi:phosphate transport system permease protein
VQQAATLPAVAPTHRTGRAADATFAFLARASGVFVLLLLGSLILSLLWGGLPAFRQFGLGFIASTDWDPVQQVFGAAISIYGTLITSALALIIGVPVAVAAAIYASELCPVRLRAPLSVLVELLAAVPSVVYGLWGIFFLAPKLQGAEQWVADRLSFVPFIGGGLVTIPNYFITGLVLAIMILPIVSAISREVMSTVPLDHKEAALGLGATRWEMIRIAVLPYCRPGIVGGAMLGLGRALGETIAVLLIISPSFDLKFRPLEIGTETVSALIAGRFGEASAAQLSALLTAGLVLFLITLGINTLAATVVARSRSGAGTDI